MSGRGGGNQAGNCINRNQSLTRLISLLKRLSITSNWTKSTTNMQRMKWNTLSIGNLKRPRGLLIATYISFIWKFSTSTTLKQAISNIQRSLGFFRAHRIIYWILKANCCKSKMGNSPSSSDKTKTVDFNVFKIWEVAIEYRSKTAYPQ